MYTGSLEQVSNRADWRGSFQLWDTEANEYIDITGCSVVLAVNHKGTQGQALLASVENEKITLLGEGVFEWVFLESEMQGVCAGSYDVGITVSNDDQTVQMFIGVVSVVYGVVP